MSDPNTDPRYSDPRLSDPVLRRDERATGPWGWIAGIAVLALIAFVIIAGMSTNTDQASNTPPAATTGQAPAGSPAPRTTTGSGATSPSPSPTSPPASSGAK